MVLIKNKTLSVYLVLICHSELESFGADSSPNTAESRYFDKIAELLARKLPIGSSPRIEGRLERFMTTPTGKYWHYTTSVYVNPPSGEQILFSVKYSDSTPKYNPGIDVTVQNLDSALSSSALEEMIPGILRTIDLE